MSKAMRGKFIFLFQERREDGTRLQSPGRFGATLGTCIERRLQIRHSSFINGNERILKNCEGHRKEKKNRKKTNVYYHVCALKKD